MGRTGTLITIQSMLEMIIDTGTLDIFNFVLGLRRQRSFMVQTEVQSFCHVNISFIVFLHQKQYIFIHDTILEAIKVGNTQIEVMNLRKKLNELGALDPETDQSGIEAEFGVSTIVDNCCEIAAQLLFVHCYNITLLSIDRN